jgi:hypothetical protein
MGEVFWAVITSKRTNALSILHLICALVNTSVPGAARKPDAQCSRQELLTTGLTFVPTVLVNTLKFRLRLL